MSDFQFRLPSIGVLPFTTPPGGSGIPWGIRLSPGATLNLGGFTTELRLEGGASNFATTPIGFNFFDSTPSSTITDHAFANWVYQPRDPHDTLRANFGVRTFTLGYRFGEDFSIRIGRHRYDVTEVESAFMNSTDSAARSAAPRLYGQETKWSHLNIPYGWFGGEIRYDRQRANESLRRFLIASSIINGADGGFFLNTQLLASFALAQGNDAPRITLAGDVAYRSNPPTLVPDTSDPGSAHGESVGLLFDYGIFTGGLHYGHQYSSWVNRAGLDGSQERSSESLLLDFHPGSFRFHGVLSWLQRADGKAINPYDPPGGQSEIETELAAGYQVVNGLQFSLGYLGSFGPTQSAHLLFLGVQTSFSGRFPF
ncbi:MAG: hypothetical protein U1F57_10015 [bacterium]